MDRCFELIFQGNFEKQCFTLILSKLIGYSIIFFSFILKVPQIKNMMKMKSDEGLSYVSIYLEIIIFLFSGLYGYHYENPFSTYGENCIILAQSLTILFLCWSYGAKASIFSKINRFLFLSSLAVLTAISIKNLLPESAWFYIGSSPVPLASVARLTQIYESYKAKSTGPLSAFTFFLALGGSAARVFTTMTETNDYLLIFTYTYGAFLNLIILIQIFIYGNKSAKSKEKSS
jgi:mannose-P-dolichol utilization defect protein 1